MRKILPYIFTIICVQLTFGQERCKIIHDTTSYRDYYISTETAPQYPDGTELMMAYIMNNMVIPNNDYEINKTIYFGFIVEVLTFLKMLKPFNYKVLIDEVIRVVKGMPKKWTPATCNNKPVPSLFVLPIKFKQNK